MHIYICMYKCIYVCIYKSSLQDISLVGRRN